MSKKAESAGNEQTAANHRQLVYGMILFPYASGPNIIHAAAPTNIAPTIQKDAIIDKYLPLTGDANISAPKEKTAGTEPPIPTPPITRHRINNCTFGTKEEAIPEMVFSAKE